MLRIATKYPSPEMIEQAISINEEIDRQLITIDEFTSYWRVSYSELAQLANTGVSTVKMWFSSKASKPTFEHRYRLTKIHQLWLKKQ